jgi:hypothetical protein
MGTAHDAGRAEGGRFVNVHLCQHCGADLIHHALLPVDARGTVHRCPDCGLNPDDGGAWHRPFDPDDEILYNLDDWEPGNRIGLTLALCDADVPFRWSPGPVLVVREEGQAVVEAFLDELEAESDATAPEEAGWEEDGSTGEEGAAALGDLFETADRLLRRPWEIASLAQMEELVGVVNESEPPFGIEPGVWEAIESGAAAVVAAGHLDDEEGVQDAARRLRALLREYV